MKSSLSFMRCVLSGEYRVWLPWLTCVSAVAPSRICRFQNKTNGVTPRRWLNQANPGLSALITKWLETDEWLKHLDHLSALRLVAKHEDLQAEWNEAKLACKVKLAARIKAVVGIDINVAALFDVQVKRLHEYKRQLLNALYCIYRYQVPFVHGQLCMERIRGSWFRCCVPFAVVEDADS